MTFAHEAIGALPAGADADAAAIRSMCERRFAYVLDTTESAANFVAVDPASGVLPLYLIQSGILFQYDSTDSTTTADGVTCLVSADGKRYKTNGVAAPYAVLSRSTSAQPGSPSVGDSYIVPTAATGAAWSGQDGKIAIYTARGWQFAVSPIGREIYVRDVDAYYHRNASGVWIGGVGSIVLQANSVTLQNVLGANASFVIKIENQTTNTPPGSPSPPTAYIIGSSPTGAWAGNTGKLAICLVAGAFTIITPVVGDVVYDKAQGIQFQFSGSAWVSLQRGMLDSFIAVSTPQTASTAGGSGSYTQNYAVPPTTSLAYQQFSQTLTFAAKAAGNKLVFHHNSEWSASAAGEFIFAIFRDSVANADDWRRYSVTTTVTTVGMQFTVTAPDSLSHTYKVRGMGTSAGGAGGGLTPQANRLFRVEEYVS